MYTSSFMLPKEFNQEKVSLDGDFQIPEEEKEESTCEGSERFVIELEQLLLKSEIITTFWLSNSLHE